MASRLHMTGHRSNPSRGQGTIPIKSKGKKPGQGTQKRDPFLTQESIRSTGPIGLKTEENKHTFQISQIGPNCKTPSQKCLKRRNSLVNIRGEKEFIIACKHQTLVPLKKKMCLPKKMFCFLHP